jgi:hypothetical protein
MPLLLKKIDASIISLFGDSGSNDFSAPVNLLQQFVGVVGREDYMMVNSFEALTQNFSSVIEGEFCTTPALFGLGKCPTFTTLNLSY